MFSPKFVFLHNWWLDFFILLSPLPCQSPIDMSTFARVRKRGGGVTGRQRSAESSQPPASPICEPTNMHVDSDAETEGPDSPPPSENDDVPAHGENEHGNELDLVYGLWNRKVVTSVTESIKRYYTGPYTCWRDTPQPLRDKWFNAFKAKYNELVKENAEKGADVSPDSLFYQAVGGYKKGVIPGLGSSVDLYYDKSKHLKSSSSTSSSYVRHLESKLQETQTKLMEQNVEHKEAQAKLKEQDERMQRFQKQMEEFSQIMHDNCGSFTLSQRKVTCDPDGDGGSSSFAATRA